MIKTINTERVPIKLWLDDIEPGAMEQARNIANFPYAWHHVAIMPDCHQGYGMPIGGVLATEDVIIPNAVGVDIGCGMCAVKTSLTQISQDKLKSIMGDIRDAIPLGFKHHKTSQGDLNMPKGYEGLQMPVVEREYNSALYQVGTLGGGNHFIEIQKGSDGYVWIMVHSGSRNIGKQVADYYNRKAIELNAKEKRPVPKSWQLAYLPVNSDEGRMYINEMRYCIDFAFKSRQLMMQKIMDILTNHFQVDFLEFEKHKMVNIAHNYASFEDHFGKKVYVHRKGATPAGKNTIGIIPGSMGAKSYIVKGKGNRESFQSCSHGAGRKMGRKEAIRTLDLKKEMEFLNSMGIIHGLRTQSGLDEAASAYKDINEVMQNQEDLVEPLIELTPLAVIKG